MYDRALINSIWALKKWYINHFLRKPDQALLYLKFLGKYCQALALGTEAPHLETYFPGVYHKGGQSTITWLPFAGELDFISKSIIGKTAFEVEQIRQLAQIASLNRALPFPSIEQIKESVSTSVKTITTRPVVKPDILDKYNRTVHSYQEVLATFNGGQRPSNRSHVSAAAASSFESTRTEGGRANAVLNRIKLLAKAPVDLQELESIKNLMDPVYGIPATQLTIDLVRKYFPELKKDDNTFLKWGDILYTTTEMPRSGQIDIELLYQSIKKGNIVIPPQLQRWMLWEASTNGLLMDRGHYNHGPAVTMKWGFFLFTQEVKHKLKFTLDKPLPVRMALSVESGMKTRLVTSSLSAVTTLLQPLRHIVDNYMSADSTLRVGIEEADKLWESLKAYKRKVESDLPKTA